MIFFKIFQTDSRNFTAAGQQLAPKVSRRYEALPFSFGEKWQPCGPEGSRRLDMLFGGAGSTEVDWVVV